MKASLETVGSDARYSFNFFTSRGTRFQGPFHWHPQAEITLIDGSTGHRYTGDHIGRFTAGDLVMYGATLPHGYFHGRKINGRPAARVLQFLPDCLGAALLQCPEAAGIRSLFERARRGLSFHGKTRERVTAIFDRFPAADGIERMIALLEVLRLLARSREVRPLASPGYAPARALYQGERINQACELISRRFREPITQAEVARATRMSPASFSRFFRRATSKTFRAFLNEVRIGQAARALLETEQTVAEICYDAGFSNLSNFNRHFLRFFKMSPRAFRKRAKLPA